MKTTTDTDADESTITGGMFNDTEVDVIVVRGTVSVAESGPSAASLPLGDVNITASADVGPTGPATYSQFHRGARPIPRFASDTTEAVTVIDVTSDQTTLTAPYALATLGFDTGFAISNMNTDDGQAGAIMFSLYQNSDDVVEYTTSAGSPGRGLTNGMLEAGATYAVLLTEILDAAGVEGGFSGYVMITTDFTGADGIAYISDWAAFSATATLK